MKLTSSVIALLTLLFFPSFVFSQIENIPSTNDVYNFLQRLYTEGLLGEYDAVILPLSKKQVNSALDSVLLRKSSLSYIDQKILDRMILKYSSKQSDEIIQFFDSFPEEFIPNVIQDKEKHLYLFKDSIINFYIHPLFEYKLIYSNQDNKLGSVINFGGRIRGSYDDWFGYYVEASNGSVIGDRGIAALDRRVSQSFTFNDTKINFFDNTQGYIRLEKGIISLQLGRERILWGAGQINKLILSNNPPIFDFIKFNIHYKSLRYDFLHGWLVMQPEIILINNDKSKEKRSKYLAISRLGFNPNNNLSLGVSQMIIYSNRAFEAAYLNPFLFWESAQRSLNDLDNSFLAFDGKLRVRDGLLLNASAIFDDINFSRLFKGEWSGHNNGFAWQGGISLTAPIIFDNMMVNFEYLQLRPYIFSHWGYKESLTYTNNGYLLGVDLNPNSTLVSFSLSYDLTDRVNLYTYFFHALHGNNEYDSLGNRTKNVGGNVFEYYTMNDSKFAPLLDGIRETDNWVRIGLNWEFFNGLFFKFEWERRKNSFYPTNDHNAFFSSIKFDFD